MEIKNGIILSFCVRKKILSINFKRHNKNTANAGKNAVIQNTLITLRFSNFAVMPGNSKGKYFIRNIKT